MSDAQTTGEDSPSADAVAERLVGAALGWMETMSVHVGDRLGWYRALAANGPTTPAELARQTSTSPRYAREWLEQQAAYGLIDVTDEGETDGALRRFVLPAGAAEALTDAGSLSYTAPLARMLAAAGAQMPAIIDAYRSGGGVSWDEFGEHARESQAEMNRPWLEAMPAVFTRHPHHHERLSRPGARLADVGMGAGWSSIALAKAYPQLRVDGFDPDEESVAMARANAAKAGVDDRVRFHLADAAAMAPAGPFDAAVAFECIHDMPAPVEVLRAMRESTGDDGFVVIMDEAVEDEFRPDAGDIDRIMYGYSLFVCLPDGLSHQPSAATGTVMRPATLRRYAQEAGFVDIEVLEDDYGFWRFYDLRRA